MDSKEYWRDKRAHDYKMEQKYSSGPCWACGHKVWSYEQICYYCKSENDNYIFDEPVLMEIADKEVEK